MSSRLIRNPDIAVEPLTWRSAGVLPSSSAERDPVHGHYGSIHGNVRPEPPGTRPDAQQELEQRTTEAYRVGLQEGEASGRQQVETELRAAIEALSRTVAEIASLRQKVRREAERELVDLSLAIARRVLHRELTIDPEALSGLIKVALHKIDLRETYRLCTHPDHVAALSRCLAEIGAPAKIEIVGDARLERGAAVFETSRGTLDASVETQLAEIQHGFADLMQTEP